MTERELKAALGSIELSETAKKRILSKCMKKEKCIMQSKRIFAAAAAAATAVILGISALAGSGVITQWFGGSSAIPEYKTLPSAEQCVKDAGFEPVLTDNIGGYTFKEGSLVSNSLADENGNVSAQFKSFSFRYENDGDRLILSQEKCAEIPDNEGEAAASVNGIDIYYTAYKNKCVPPDYKMTEEDKAAEASGELVFSWGTDSISVDEIRSVSWTDGDCHFNIHQRNGRLSKEELIKLAEEIINMR